MCAIDIHVWGWSELRKVTLTPLSFFHRGSRSSFAGRTTPLSSSSLHRSSAHPRLALPRAISSMVCLRCLFLISYNPHRLFLYTAAVLLVFGPWMSSLPQAGSGFDGASAEAARDVTTLFVSTISTLAESDMTRCVPERVWSGSAEVLWHTVSSLRPIPAILDSLAQSLALSRHCRGDSGSRELILAPIFLHYCTRPQIAAARKQSSGCYCRHVRSVARGGRI